MATRRPIQHIDRRDLYTNLEARILYLHTFTDFSSRQFSLFYFHSQELVPLRQ